ncbi:MAG: exodeoxyribonuclease VII large subunit [Anaerolineales bacterium]|jgi:exodeoxyribonuclease VII large subunit
MQAQFSLFPPEQSSFTVFEINTYLRELLESDRTLQDIWVTGEVSNLSLPKSGHMYFTLKDAQASLRCVMWRNQVLRLPRLPQEGEAVEVHGSISVYEAAGQYQLYADQVRPAGEGLLYQEFLRLKKQLEAEGLFDQDRKRPIPTAPPTIGIVSSPTGAAIRDMLNTLRRRYPLAQVVLAPSAVQGEAAPDEITAAIQRLNQFVQPDVILVSRGGGSIEDLWAFNSEKVARAIAASDAPVISGVGHETDFTIADFVADLRAPTPTAAAELAAPDQLELRGILLERQESLLRNTLEALEEQRWALRQSAGRLERESPRSKLATARQQIDEHLRRGERTIQHNFQIRHTQLAGAGQELAALSPKNVLGRGYAVVSTGKRLVKSNADVQPGDPLRVQVSDGEFEAEVREKRDEDD